jgi:hypothetical protein
VLSEMSPFSAKAREVSMDLAIQFSDCTGGRVVNKHAITALLSNQCSAVSKRCLPILAALCGL